MKMSLFVIVFLFNFCVMADAHNPNDRVPLLVERMERKSFEVDALLSYIDRMIQLELDSSQGEMLIRE